MITIAVDTSGPVCGVAVLKDDRITGEEMVLNRMTHSANLMPMIDRVLTESEINLGKVDRIACVTGPGSFTGVRIGVSTVKGIAHGRNIECVAVDALEAMAAGAGHFDGVICPIQDARAGQVYGAAFAPGCPPERLMEDQPMALDSYLETIRTFGKRFLFLGDGMPVHKEKIRAILGDAAVFAPPQLAFLRPASVAVLGAMMEHTLNYKELMPMYLRAPSAERNRKLVEAAQNGR